MGASLQNGDASEDAVFEQEWDRVVDAQAEGALSLITWGETWGGAGFPAVIERFEQEFPGITVELYAESSADVLASLSPCQVISETIRTISSSVGT